MSDLKDRFGSLLAAHRKRAKLTQHALAERADLSIDMIARLEGGKTGAGFDTIERLSAALGIDPAELFSTADGQRRHGRTYQRITARLAQLSETDLLWTDRLLDAALTQRR